MWTSFGVALVFGILWVRSCWLRWKVVCDFVTFAIMMNAEGIRLEELRQSIRMSRTGFRALVQALVEKGWIKVYDNCAFPTDKLITLTGRPDQPVWPPEIKRG